MAFRPLKTLEGIGRAVGVTVERGPAPARGPAAPTAPTAPTTPPPAAKTPVADDYGRASTPTTESPELPLSARPVAPAPARAKGPTSVSTLSHVQLPARFDSATLTLDLPLKAGTWPLKLGDKTAIIEVPPGTVLHVEAAVDGKSGAPMLDGATLRANHPLRVKNAEDLVELNLPGVHLASKAVGLVVDVQLDGMTVGKDGVLMPDLSVVTPSLNPLSYLKGKGFDAARHVPLARSLMPQLNTDARALLAGQFFSDPYSSALTKPIMPHGIDLGAVLGGLGAMAGQGHFALDVRTDIGDIKVGEGAVAVTHDGSPMRLEVSGDFTVGKQGDVSAQVEGKVDTGLVDASFSADVNAKAGPTHMEGSIAASAHVSSASGGDIRLEAGDGAISVGHGAVTATHEGDSVVLSLGGKTLEIAQELGKKMMMKIGSDVTATLDADVSAGADFAMNLTPDGVVVSAQDVQAAVQSGGIDVAAQNYGVTFGTGSSLKMRAGSVTVDPVNGVSVNDHQGNFTVNIPAARVKKWGGTAEGTGHVEGTIDLQPAASKVGVEADATVRGHAGFGRFHRLTPNVTVEQTLAVEVTPTGVTVQKS